MNFAWTFVAVLAFLALTEAAPRKQKYRSAFVDSLEELHRGPPELPSFGANVTTKWITQKLNHFDDKNNATWQMRYMVNEEYLKDAGPMFIRFGGEKAISAGKIKTGIFHDLAKEHKGILFYTEHRYYGQSRPTSDLSTENLQKYLHVKQALADVAHFIRYQRETDPRLSNSKVIIAGGSYSATMVVWFSKLYPELVNGGWASSAPILAKVDFKEYKEVIGKALIELGSQQCYDRVKNGIAELEALFAGNRSDEAKAMFLLCNDFDQNNDLDLWTLFAAISNIFARIVQYQKERDVSEYCDNLMSFQDDLTAIASSFLSKAPRSYGCVDVTYENSLHFYRRTSYIYGATRPWWFQMCNEYGWFPSSTSVEQPFGTKIPVTLFVKICSDAFGSQYTNEHIHELVDGTNRDFGGLNPQVENVYMTHGALDPWCPVGLNETHGATVIPRASHFADSDSINFNDSNEMRASKERLAELVREWLA